MRYRKIISRMLLFGLLCGYQITVTAQPSTIIDSLKRELSISGNASDSASILNNLTWKLGRSNPEEAYRYGMKSLELSPRIKNRERIAEIYDAAAFAYRYKGDIKKSLEFYKKSLEVGQKYKYLSRIAWGTYNLALLSPDDRISERIEYAKLSRAAFKQINDIGMLLVSDWLLINYQRGHNSVYIDTAITDYEFARSITREPDAVLDQYVNLIYLYGMKDNKTKAMSYAMKALELAESAKNENALLNAYYQIGNYLRDDQHNYDVALLYYEKILDAYKKADRKMEMAEVLSDIGITNMLMGNDILALSCYNKSLDNALKIGHRHSIANAYNCIGEIYYRQKKYKDALFYFKKCYETGCDICPKIVFHKTLLEIGRVYMDSKDYGNALGYFNKSLILADSAKANAERAASYNALGDIQNTMNQPALALTYYHKALDLASGSNSLSLQKDISLKLSGLYRNSNNFQKAYEFLSLSNMLADSLNRLNQVQNISSLVTKFEFQNLKLQKEHELKESRIKANAEIDRQSQLKYFFIICFILTTIFGLIIYRNFRRKKDDNFMLEKQKVQLKEMAEKMHEADQKRLRFFANISHELRTPLTLILGPVEKLIGENSNQKTNSLLLGIIHRNTLQLYNLINQLLDIRKLDTGNVTLKVTFDDLTGYCKGIFATFVHLATEKDNTYNFIAPAESISGWFDRDILEKALNNLLSNAFKFTGRNGKIDIALSAVSEDWLSISGAKIIVSDNGQGIPEDQLQYVFDRYYQVENTNTGFNTGTGIGLAYAKELIELHKGKLNVESKVNGGTTFIITIPVHESYYSPGEKLPNSRPAIPNGTDDIRQKYLEEVIVSEHEPVQLPENSEPDVNPVILIIEDNADLRTFIKSIFGGEFKIYEAPDGAIGYEIALEIIPDIIISDIMMTGMDGLKLCGKLKGNIHTNHIPILLLTAKAGEENEIEGFKTGADDYLTKPFNSEILEMRIKSLLASRERFREHFTREFLLNPAEVKLSSPEDEFLKKAVKVVEDNISNPDLNVDFLIKELNVSRTQLFRKLKAITNYSANQFIRNIRLKRAAQLLQSESQSISEVLYLSGFNSPSYFSSCFKEMYGCLPKDYCLKTEEPTKTAD